MHYSIKISCLIWRVPAPGLTQTKNTSGENCKFLTERIPLELFITACIFNGGLTRGILRKCIFDRFRGWFSENYRKRAPFRVGNHLSSQTRENRQSISGLGGKIRQAAERDSNNKKEIITGRQRKPQLSLRRATFTDHPGKVTKSQPSRPERVTFPQKPRDPSEKRPAGIFTRREKSSQPGAFRPKGKKGHLPCDKALCRRTRETRLTSWK